MELKSVTVYCGAAVGKNPEFAEAAKELGREIAKRNLRLIYGAGKCGLMGILADSVLQSGGFVTGVVPRQFVPEVVHQNLSEIIYTNSISARKLKMAELGDAHIAIAGGLGTLDEITDALELLQLGESSAPCGFLNTANFYTPIFDFLDSAHAEGFISKIHRDMALVSQNPAELLDALKNYQRPPENLFWKKLDLESKNK